MRNQRGSNNNGSKISEQTASDIKGLFAKGLKIRTIARFTNVSRYNVWAIVHGKSWIFVAPNLSIEIPPDPPKPTIKRCPRCGMTKDLAEFPKKKNTPLGVNSYCLACKNIYASESNRTARENVLNILGGRCACCGEDTFEFLSIDHVNGGGNKDRKLNGQKGAFKRIQKGLHSPGEFRVLCYNCNLAIGFYGVCPHAN